MEVQSRQGPAFGVARITMGPHERIKAEAGAMMATVPSVIVEAKAEGGVLKSLKRAALGGESCESSYHHPCAVAPSIFAQPTGF